MENKIRVYKPNSVVELKLNTIIDLINDLKNNFNCDLAFDNTMTNRYKIYYNGEKYWEFETYPSIIRALNMLKTILEDKRSDLK
jgi:hypothetical protein